MNPEVEQPTQVSNPERATIRTLFQATISLAAGVPLLIQATEVKETAPGVAVVLGVAGAITRVMALPWTESFLQRFLPWLAAHPRG